jgi:hypothetical protein
MGQDAKLSRSLTVAETGMGYLHPNNDQLRMATAELLCLRVQAMNVNNFVVRPQRRWVEKFAQPQAWKRLSSMNRPTETSAHKGPRRCSRRPRSSGCFRSWKSSRGGLFTPESR